MPPDSTLKYFRALGVEEFAHACGWESDSKNLGYIYHAAFRVNNFKSWRELIEFLHKWNLQHYLHASDADQVPENFLLLIRKDP